MEGLNPDSPLPLYHQLAERLLGRIRSGAYPSGSRIPSEPELARTFGIGRPTVRQATDLLVRRRVVERKRGSGTFVREASERVDLLSLAGTMASFEKGGLAVRTTLVERPHRVAVVDDPENPFSDRDAIRLARISRLKEVPVLLEEIYIDPDCFPGIEQISLAGRSLSQWVESHYHMRPQSADQTFRVAQAGSKRAALLGLSQRQPILEVKRTLHFKNARSAIYAELYCRTDQLVFSQTLEGVGDD
ncbi:MAG: GntR family transcriptional regulator [Myxococcales bacterium]|nr:GntR family transcriptional regulator [Myxococcales bacterium]